MSVFSFIRDRSLWVIASRPSLTQASVTFWGHVRHTTFLQMCFAVASASYHWGTRPPPSTCNSFICSSLWSNFARRANYPSIVYFFARLDDADIKTHSFFDQYCIISSSCCTRSWSQPWVLRDIISIFAPPRNKSCRHHWALVFCVCFRVVFSVFFKLCVFCVSLYNYVRLIFMYLFLILLKKKTA